jgi:hypothetical protein
VQQQVFLLTIRLGQGKRRDPRISQGSVLARESKYLRIARRQMKGQQEGTKREKVEPGCNAVTWALVYKIHMERSAPPVKRARPVDNQQKTEWLTPIDFLMESRR